MSRGEIETPNPISCDIFRHSMSRALESWARLSQAGRLARRPTSAPSASVSKPSPQCDDQSGRASRPKCVGGTHVRDLDGERIVYDPATHEVVVLNETAAFILELCDGEHSVDEMLAALRRRYEAPEDRLESDLRSTLADLRDRRLVSG